MSLYLDFLQHHPYLFAALGTLLLLLIANELHGAATAGPRLGPMEAVRLMNDRDAVVVDVRPAPDYKKSHLLSAINLPLVKLGERASELGKDKARPVLVYCALGGSSIEAAKTLRKAGFSEVYPLRGGLNAWLGANLPVTAK